MIGMSFEINLNKIFKTFSLYRSLIEEDVKQLLDIRKTITTIDKIMKLTGFTKEQIEKLKKGFDN